MGDHLAYIPRNKSQVSRELRYITRESFLYCEDFFESIRLSPEGNEVGYCEYNSIIKHSYFHRPQISILTYIIWNC